MSIALCDPDAFYPFRRLVEGPFEDLEKLAKVERFLRTVVLHDRISMSLAPLPYDPISNRLAREEHERRLHDEGRRARARNIMVAIGPSLDDYDFFEKRDNPTTQEVLNIRLSSTITEVAKEFSNAGEENPYYEAHIEYLKKAVAVIQKGGSALLADEFGSTAIGEASKFPKDWFAELDEDWENLARAVHAGSTGIVVPPVLSIVLTRCAHREAIPNIVRDLREEWTSARAKFWELLDRLQTARTVAEAQNIQKELEEASRLLSPSQEVFSTKPTRVLWDLIAGGAAGASASLLVSGNDPFATAVSSAAIGASRSLAPLLRELGPTLFGRGAFDLASRIRREARRVEYDALARLLTDAEKKSLGL